MAVWQGRDELLGREREIGVLLAALDDMERGSGRLVLIGGDPGIGKTRLVDDLATRARERGSIVLWGRGWQDAGAPPYWPWVQVLRASLRATGVPTGQHLRRHVAQLSPIVPELAELLGPGELPPPGEPLAPADPESARYRLFDAVTALLLEASAHHPVVVVVDDLHAADASSILLLRFLVGQLAGARLLVLATYRDAELTPGHPLLEGLADLAREPSTRVLPLGGIGSDAVAEFLTRSNGRRPPRAVVRALLGATGGNPLFLGEAARLFGSDPAVEDLAEAGLAAVMPPSIREVIRRRIAPLGPETLDLLRLASAIGPEFGIELLALLAGLVGRTVAERLVVAIRAGLVVDLGVAGRYRFSHDLIRESLYGEIPSADAARLHQRIATTLERLDEGSQDRSLSALAYHFARALVGSGDGTPQKALDYAAHAGRAAVRALAYEEAARSFRLALRALESSREPDPRQRCRLLLELGDAEARAGDLAGAQEALLAAADIARSIDEPEELARAALGYGGRFIWSRVGSDPYLIPMLEDALRLLEGRDVRLRIRVMARLACAWRSAPERRVDSDRLTREAMELARGLDDPSSLSYALAGRFWATYWPENPRERLDIAREILEVARQTGDGERLLDGHQTMCIVDLDLGWIAAARSEIEAAKRTASELRQPTQVFAMRTYEEVLALLEGSFGEAEAMLAADATGPDINSAGDTRSVDAMHWFLLRREQGRSAEVEGVIRSLARDEPWYPYFRSVLTCVLLDEGRLDEARAAFDDLARDDFRALYPDCQWLVGVCLAAEACARLGDVAAAEALYRRLEPFAGRHAVAHAEGSVGTVDRYLGLLAASMDRLDDADRHLAAALELDRRLGAQPWLAHDLADRADVLRRRNAAGDAGSADRLEDQALALADGLGMIALSERLAGRPEAASVADRPASATDAPTAGDPMVGVFRHEGEYWTIGFGGVECRLRDSKGLAYLARLLAEPTREIAALDLAAGLAAGGRVAPALARPRDGTLRDAGFGDAGELLDAAARRAYRERILELGAEIDEAEDWNDPERLARLQAERSILIQQLAAAVGIGGRVRVAGSAAERARLSVAKAIRSALARIHDACPPLGRHLAVAVHTGSFCAYVPDPALALDWRL